MAEAGEFANAALGRAIRFALARSGFTLREAAIRAGLNYRTVLRYVNGERDMPLPVLLALSHATDIDLQALVNTLEGILWPMSRSTAARDEDSDQQRTDEPISPKSATGLEPAAVAAAQRELDAQMAELGVTSLAARSVEPVGASELLVVAEVVQEIVLELRASNR